MMLRAYGSTDATMGSGKVRNPGGGRGGGNGKGPNSDGGSSIPWANVKALLHFDGSNGGTTFTDEVGNPWTPRGGLVITSTAQKKFGPSSLTSTDAFGITTTILPGSVITTNDFCMECFFYPKTGGVAVGWIAQKPNTSGASRGNYSLIWGNLANKVQFLASRDAATYQVNIPSDSTLTNDVWHHIAAVRNAGVWMMYIDGVKQSTTVTDAADWTGLTDNSFYIFDSIATGGVNGHFVDEFRLVVGLPVYTGASFTPPSAPFPNS